MKEFKNVNSIENREAIAGRVLDSTGRNSMFNANEVESVRVNYGELTQKGVQDAVVTVKFGPKSTIMAVYTPVDGKYEYVGEIGYFYDVGNIKFLQPGKNGLEIVAFKEKNNQTAGALENNSFTRTYGYDDGKFQNLLNIDENIETWWTDTVYRDNNSQTWYKITQTSNIQKSDDDRSVEAVKTQIYYVAEDYNKNGIPDEEEFSELGRRSVKELYYWDDSWERFILDEATEKATDKNVAVIQDYGYSPYVLTGDEFDKYRILRRDGTSEIVDYDALKFEK